MKPTLLIKKIVDIIKKLSDNKFTGELTLTFVFQEGGIRKTRKNVEEEVIPDSLTA